MSKVKAAAKKVKDKACEHKGIIFGAGVLVLAIVVCKMDFTSAQDKMKRIMDIIKEDALEKEEKETEEADA